MFACFNFWLTIIIYLDELTSVSVHVVHDKQSQQKDKCIKIYSSTET